MANGIGEILGEKQLGELKAFVGLCKASPEILEDSKLKFFKDYLVSIGCTKFANTTKCCGGSSNTEKDKTCNGAPKIESESESEVESKMSSPSESEKQSDDEKDEEESEEISTADDTEIMEKDNEKDFPAICEDPDKCPEEPAEETIEKVAKLKEEVSELIESNDKSTFSQIISKLTEVIISGVRPSGMVYCKRADILLKVKKPLAAIRDCTEAIKLNPDNAKGYKIRGKAYRYIGDYVSAHKDLDVGQKIDYDDGLWEMQKFVDGKFAVINGKLQNKQRMLEEKEKKRKEAEMAKRKKAANKLYEKQKKEEKHAAAGGNGMPGGMGGMPGGMGGMPGGMPGGMGGMPGGMGGMPGGMGGMPGGMGGMPGGMPGGGDMGNLFANLLGDPEMKEIMSNPKVSQAMKDMMSGGPEAMNKYKDDPEVMKAFEKLNKSFGGMGGMPGGMGGMPGGMGGMGGMPGGMGGMPGGMGGMPGGMGGMPGSK